MRPIHALADVARTFDAAAAAEKVRLLGEVAASPRVSVGELALLRDVLGFLLAYPDDARVRRAAEATSAQLEPLTERLLRAGHGEDLEESGLPGTTSRRVLSYDLARVLSAELGAELEVDWELLEDQGKLHDVLGTLVLVIEAPALDDIEIGTRAWIEARVEPGQTGLQALIEVFESRAMAPELRAALFESCEVPLRLDDPRAVRGRNELRFPVERMHYQRAAIPRERWKLAPRIRRELRNLRRLTPTEARARLRLARLAMGSRDLEIYPLTHADERDVQLIACGRGVEVLLAGVQPDQRCAFESLYYYLVTKNGVPIAYGPASPFLGSCEMGINFFEEFRGAETRFVYTQVMRVLYHLLGVRNFYVTPYGMGKGNAAALASGAFWFYRKLGFATSSAEVEQLARAEEQRMGEDPRYRSDPRTLRRLSATAAYLDLSRGECPRFDSSALAGAVTRDLGRARGISRADYARRCARRLARLLDVTDLSSWSEDERSSLTRMAPALSLISDLTAWPAGDRRALVGIVRAKAGRSEARAATRMLAHPRLAAALRRICESVAD